MAYTAEQISDINTFLRYIKLNTNGCWEWTGNKTAKGYGQFRIHYKTWRAHRWIYNFMIGDLIPKMEIDHLCNNPSCCNPFHLEQVTGDENRLRAMNNPLRTHCFNGHEFTPTNTYINKNGGRRCKICQKEWQNNYEGNKEKKRIKLIRAFIELYRKP